MCVLLFSLPNAGRGNFRAKYGIQIVNPLQHDRCCLSCPQTVPPAGTPELSCHCLESAIPDPVCLSARNVSTSLSVGYPPPPRALRSLPSALQRLCFTVKWHFFWGGGGHWQCYRRGGGEVKQRQAEACKRGGGGGGWTEAERGEVDVCKKEGRDESKRSYLRSLVRLSRASVVRPAGAGEAGYGRPVDRGAWTAKTVKRTRQQPAHPQYANYWAPLTRKRQTMPHPAQPQHTNDWAPRTRKRHQQEHRPQRPTESSDPTQHAKGRTGDCPGPRKGATTRRNVTQGVNRKEVGGFVSTRGGCRRCRRNFGWGGRS